MASDICLMDLESSSFGDDEATPTIVTRNYTIKVISDPPDRYTAETDLRNYAGCPAVDPDYTNLYRKDISVTKVGENARWYEAQCTWERWQPDSVSGGFEFLSGSVTRTQQTVIQSYSRVGSYAVPGETPIDNFNFINSDISGVDGIEISVPVMAFSLRKSFASGTFNLAWLADAYNYVGKPNSVAWRDFAIGEIMLIGVDGSNDDPEKDVISFSYEAKPSQTNITFRGIRRDYTEGVITVPLVRGFDKVTVVPLRNPDVEAQNTGLIPPAAHTVYVDQPDEYADLNQLFP